MHVETITRLLTLSPSGLTNDQILWYFRRSGLRPSAAEIGQTLAALADTAVAGVTPGGRWRLTRFRTAPVGPDAKVSGGGPGPAPAASLCAIPGRAIPLQAEPQAGLGADVPKPGGPEGANAADADWRKLIAYYAATQRLDPRGAVDERADRHGLSWQLVRVDGAWWSGCSLRFALGQLPSRFREALARRPGTACSIGYPVSLFEDGGVPCLVPAVLLPATFQFDAADAIFEITASEPALNPRWLAPTVSRLQGWSKDQLTEALFPEGEFPVLRRRHPPPRERNRNDLLRGASTGDAGRRASP